MLEMAKDGSFSPYSLVKYNGVEYVIWKDKDGPVYSTVCEEHHPERILAGSRNTVYWGGGLDTVTNRVMGDPYHASGGLMCSTAG